MGITNKSYRIAILSGKGGTGKTLVSVNLAVVAGRSVYVDCDVEEPNGHLFFKPEISSSDNIAVLLPQVDRDLCNGCRKCVDFCKFHALAFIKNKPLLFEDVCHSCGGCKLICPEEAITERSKVIGRVETGTSEGVTVMSGTLNLGEASGIPIIKNLMQKLESVPELPAFIDCPPGSACVVMESIQNADFCLFVAEPTIFGTHNLAMVYELARLFNKPHAVVLNKCLSGDNPSERFCMENHIPIVGRIPFDTELGLLNSNGEIVARKSKQFAALFSKLLRAIEKEVGE